MDNKNMLESFRQLAKKLKSANFYLFSLLVLTASLRFINLGYSDYQGDEIKALYLEPPGTPFLTYLIEQRKGPVQFVVTYITKLVLGNYDNRFLVRLPFALAGFFSVLFFYKFLELHFGKRIAFIASFFFTTNGFFIAFSRIAQYQAFVLFFSTLALYLISLKPKSSKKEVFIILAAFTCWALGMLSHYDALFIAPIFLFLVVSKFVYIQPPKIKGKWNTLRGIRINKKLFIGTFFSGLIALSMVAVFYIPFFQNLGKSTQDYWNGRITGVISTKNSSSKYLFRVYQPIYVIHVYTGFALLGFLYFTYLFVLYKDLRLRGIFLSLWLAFPLVFMEILVAVPGTHIYTYLIPLTLYMAYGVLLGEKIFSKILSKFPIHILNFNLMYQMVLTMVLTFIVLQVYAIYIDNTVEYPWRSEKFYIWEFTQPTQSFHLSLFGFPYNRNWDGISAFIKDHSTGGITHYYSNERASITRYYVEQDSLLAKSADKAGFCIHIKSPQSFSENLSADKARYWTSKYPPLYTYSRNGEDLANVYIMEPGNEDELKLKGY